MVAKILWQVWHLTAQVLTWIDLTPIKSEWMAPTAKPSSMWPLRTGSWSSTVDFLWFTWYLVCTSFKNSVPMLRLFLSCKDGFIKNCTKLSIVLLWYDFLRFYPSQKFSIILMILLNYLPAEHSKFSDLGNVLMRRNSKTTVASLNPK